MDGYLLVTNSSAGIHKEEHIEAVCRILAEKGPVEVVATETSEELDEVAARAAGRTVVVAGGDGSLHAVVNALYRAGVLAETPVGLVPLGTGNDFARGSGIDLDPERAAVLIATSEPSDTDLMLDTTGTVVVNNAHLGVGAEASRAGSGWKKRLGRFGYVVGAVEAGLRPEFVRVRVEVDGRMVHDGRVAQVAVGNGPSVGGGTELVPGAEPGSGRIMVIVSEAVGPLNRLLYAARLRRGEHHRMREVTRISGSTVEVSGEEFWISSDGELSGPHRAMRWQVLSAAMRMHVPRD